MGVARAKLIKRGWLTRVFRLETAEGDFEVAYRGAGFGEWVDVDGVKAAKGRIWHLHMVDPRIEFLVGGTRAVFEVQAWPWLTTKAIRLTVGGRVVYSEGRCEKLPDNPLLTLNTEVKYLERKLASALPRRDELRSRAAAAAAQGSDHEERCANELRDAAWEVERLETELELARRALRQVRRT